MERPFPSESKKNWPDVSALESATFPITHKAVENLNWNYKVWLRKGGLEELWKQTQNHLAIWNKHRGKEREKIINKNKGK